MSVVQAFKCIMRRHTPPDGAEDELFKKDAKYYDCKCKSCGTDIRLSKIKNDADYFYITELPFTE